MSTRVLHQTTRRLIGAVDRAVLERILTPLPAALDPIESLTHAERMAALTAFAAFYDRPEHLLPHSAFFSRTSSTAPQQRKLRRYRRDGDVVDLSWPSDFSPMWSTATAEAYFSGELARS